MHRILAGLTASCMMMLSASPVAAGGRTVACYEPVELPPVYETVAERVLVRPARHVAEIVPAEYGYQERTIEVEPPGIETRVIPAQYYTAEETVLIRPAQVIHRSTPPVYREVSERVLIEPARHGFEWRVIHGKRVLCKVVFPARYGHERRRVVVHPGQTIREMVPAQYGVRHRTVQLAPERHQPIVRPARYTTVREKVVIRPQHEVVRTIPPEYETRYREVKVRAAHQGWAEVHLRGSGC